MRTLSDFPTFLHPLFAAIGAAMKSPQLHPDVLLEIPSQFPGAAPGQAVIVQHLSADALGRRKGRYRVALMGQQELLSWTIWPGELQELAEQARRQASGPTP